MNEPAFSFDDEGRLVLSFGVYGDGWREASCCECGEPVRWVLDMGSFRHNGRGSFELGHAWCLWRPEGFDGAKARAAAARGRTG